MQNKESNTEKRWVFIPVKKTRVLKRTEQYLLLVVDDTITEHNGYIKTFISTKFLRSKETEDALFLSLPEDMIIRLDVSEKTENGGYRTENVKNINPWTLRKLMLGELHANELKGWSNELFEKLFGKLPF